MTFDVGAEIAVSVDQNSLRSARSTIEDEIQDVTVGVDAGGSSLPGGSAIPDGGMAAAGGTAILDELEEQTEALLDLQDTMEQSAVSGGGGGGALGSILPGGGGGGSGGGLSGLVGGVSFGALVSKVSLKSLLTKAPAFATLVTAASLSDDLVKGELGPDDIVDSAIKLGDIMTFGLSPNDLVSGTIGAATLIGGTVQIASLVSGTLSGTALGGYLGSVGMGTLVNPLTGGLVALLGGSLALHDLVDGEISDWNLPAKFGKALGKGFEDEWPGMAEDIHNAFTNNPFYEMGQKMRQGFDGESEAPISGLSGSDSTHPEAEPAPGDGTDIEENTTGGDVGEQVADATGNDTWRDVEQPTQNRAQGRQVVLEVTNSPNITVNTSASAQDIRDKLREAGLDPDAIDRVVQDWERMQRRS